MAKRPREKIATAGWHNRLNRNVKDNTYSVLVHSDFKAGRKTRIMKTSGNKRLPPPESGSGVELHGTGLPGIGI